MLGAQLKAPDLVEGRGLESPEMELISLVRPEHGNTPPRRLRRRWYKSVIDSEHHNVSKITRLIAESQPQMSSYSS